MPSAQTVVFVVTFENEVVGVCKDKQIATETMVATWSTYQLCPVLEMRGQSVIRVFTHAKIGEVQGQYLGEIRIMPFGILEVPDHF